MADALHFEDAFLHCDAHLSAVYAGASEIQPVMPPARARRLQFGNEVRYETGGGLLREPPPSCFDESRCLVPNAINDGDVGEVREICAECDAARHISADEVGKKVNFVSVVIEDFL